MSKSGRWESRVLVGAPVLEADWLRPTPIQKTNNHNFAPRTLNSAFPLVNFKSKRAKTASFYHTKLVFVLVVKPVWWIEIKKVSY